MSKSKGDARTPKLNPLLHATCHPQSTHLPLPVVLPRPPNIFQIAPGLPSTAQLKESTTKKAGTSDSRNHSRDHFDLQENPMP